MKKEEYFELFRQSMDEHGFSKEKTESYVNLLDCIPPDEEVCHQHLQELRDVLDISTTIIGKNDDVSEAITVEDDNIEEIIEIEGYATDDFELQDDDEDIEIAESFEDEDIPTTAGYKRWYWKTMPLFALLYMAIYLAFGIGTALIMLLTAVCTVGVIADVVVGLAVVIIGSAYGVGQLSTALPIALFEIGLVIINIGLTVLIGMGLYFCAFKGLPYVFRKFKELLGLVLGKVREIYAKRKKEYAKQV